MGLTKILGKIEGLECQIRKEWGWPKNGRSSNHLGFPRMPKVNSRVSLAHQKLLDYEAKLGVFTN